MANLIKLGVLVTAIGLVLPLFGVRLPGLATVVYPEKFWYAVSPDGTKDQPTVVTAGSSIELKAQIVYLDTATGSQILGDPRDWEDTHRV